MTVRTPLLQILADGRFHSGELLGRQLNVTRAAIWKQLKGLEALGIVVHAVRGKGYRLAHPIELLKPDAIEAQLAEFVHRRVARLDVLPEIDSTNAYLKAQAALGAPSGVVCLAESQTAGRGRHGRVWVSPFGSNLYLSLLWRFETGPGALSGLSLAVGVALARALKLVAGASVGLKWPNDLLWQGRKLGGILVEMAGESAGPCHAVIGIGINVRMPDRAGQAIEQPWVDLFRVCGQTLSRNKLAAAVLEQLILALTDFESRGLSPFLDEWRDFDVAAGRSVQLHLPNEVVDGRAQGIDDNGALIVQVGDEVRRFGSGEISLRMIS